MAKQTEKSLLKPKYRTPVQLGVSRELLIRLKAHAANEGLALAAWLRHLAIRELRRSKSSL